MNWKQNKPKYGWAVLWKTKVVFVEWQRSFVNFNEIKTVLFRVKIVSTEWQCYFYSSGNRLNHNRSSLYIIIQNKGKSVVGGLPHKQYEIDQSIKSNFISVFSYQTMAPTKSSVIGVFFLLSAALITCRGHIWSRNRFISWSPAAVEFLLAIYSILSLLFLPLLIFFEITRRNKIPTKTTKIRIRAILPRS